MKPKCRHVTTLALMFLSLAAAVQPAAAGTLKDLFGAAMQSNLDYQVYQINLELANLKKTKGEIESKTEIERLNTQYSYLSALSDYRTSVLDFYNNVINAIYGAAIAEVDVSLTGLKLENAQEDRRYADARYKNGLISAEEFNSIEISYKTALTNNELAISDFEDAKNNVVLITGLKWTADILPELPSFEWKADIEDWIAKNIRLEMAMLSQKVAATKMEALALNASAYERKIQETELRKADVAATNARNAARRSYDSLFAAFKNQTSLLQIRTSEYSLQETSYADAIRRYDKGLLSLSDKNLAAISVFTARRNLLLVQKSYLATIGSYLSTMGENPLGL